nr:TetR/AcrR family transcriptional regulator [Chloroflexia bacterium]
SDGERLNRMRHNAEFLADRGYLREDITIDKATDVLYTCSSLEIYEVLVLQRGWPPPEFARFVANFMISTLLTPTEKA